LRRSSSAKSTHVNIDDMALLPASNLAFTLSLICRYVAMAVSPLKRPPTTQDAWGRASSGGKIISVQSSHAIPLSPDNHWTAEPWASPSPPPPTSTPSARRCPKRASMAGPSAFRIEARGQALGNPRVSPRAPLPTPPMRPDSSGRSQCPRIAKGHHPLPVLIPQREAHAGEAVPEIEPANLP
jgi:hypothetical protein